MYPEYIFAQWHIKYNIDKTWIYQMYVNNLAYIDNMLNINK